MFRPTRTRSPVILALLLGMLGFFTLPAHAASGPSAATNVVATAGNNLAVVSWTAPTAGAPVVSYTIRSYAGATPGPTENVLAAYTTAGVDELTNGTSYTFTVQVVHSSGGGPESVASAPVTPRTTPAAPTGLTAMSGNRSALLSWSAPADGGSAITSYLVTVSPPGDAPIEVLAPDTFLNVTGLTNETSYTFTVAAVNAAGTGSASESSAPVIPTPTLSSAPSDVTATAGVNSAGLSWQAPDNGGSPITSYLVNVYSEGTLAKTVTAQGTSTTVTGLTAGTAYTFMVAAVNAVGTGPDSSASAAITPAAAPDTVKAGPIGPVAGLQRSGYWMVGSAGAVYGFGDARWLGNAPTTSAVDLEPTGSGDGYWIVDDLGRVYAFGDAVTRGNVDSAKLVAGEKVSSLSATRTGNGYWIFTTRGRALAFGDAKFLGDVSTITLNGPVLDSIATPSGNGYYMVAGDGGIFAFGDAMFYGSMGGKPLNSPVLSLVPDSDGVGYWLVAGDGGVFSFEALFNGSMGATRLDKPITGMVRNGAGYLMVGQDGGIFNFSNLPFFGSLGGNSPAFPIVSVAVVPTQAS
jgi:hypothetical protein